MNGDDHEEAQALPAAAHRPIRIVRPLRQRNLTETTRPIIYVVAYGTFVFAILAVIAFIRGAQAPGVVFVIIAAMLALKAFLAAARVERESRDEFFRLKADRFKFCPDCGYDLRGCTDEGPCPECAAVYDLEFLEQTWTMSYKSSVTIVIEDSREAELRAINEFRRQRWSSQTRVSGPPHRVRPKHHQSDVASLGHSSSVLATKRCYSIASTSSSTNR